MTLTVLNVAFPLAPVGPDAVGGAEQVLTQVDRALVRAGHRSIVIACEGSRVAGELQAVPRRAEPLDGAAWGEIHRHHAEAIRDVLARWPVDLVHMHGIDFHRYLPPPGVPVLATLHLPPAWYPAEVFRLDRPGTWVHCVSHAQAASCPPSSRLLSPIPNGVPVDEFAGARPSARRRTFAAALGRICPEKGFHLALEAARRADAALLLAGAVFPFEEHRRYFEREIRPRLDRRRRFVGPVGVRSKRGLLGRARCLLVPSLAPETSSLVAMEALASGTPVVAFRVGALSEIVEHGRTGYLVDDAHEMAEAIASVPTLDPAECRAAARERFSATRMSARYLDRYAAIAEGCAA
ncbi:MAG TPA: glycosyltransferase [Gemmatimonadales bacterium]|nr:glycosyltransferase [Gemmatimonadales bacterium]